MGKPVLSKRSLSTICLTYMLIPILVLMVLLMLTACRTSLGVADESRTSLGVAYENGRTLPDATITPGIETVPQERRLFVELVYSLFWDKDECYGEAGEMPPPVYVVREDGVWFAQEHPIPENTIGFVATDFQYLDLGGQGVIPIVEVPFAIEGWYLEAVKILRANEDGSIIVEVFGEPFLLQAEETFRYNRIHSLVRPNCEAHKRYEIKNYGWLDADMFHVTKGQDLYGEQP